MSITLSVGTTDLNVNQLADLKNDLPTVLQLANGVMANSLDQQVSQYPDKSAVAVKYVSGNNCWTVGAFTFGLSGSVSGSVKLLRSGDTLSTYTKAFATTVGDDLAAETHKDATATITVGDGEYYVQISLDLGLSVSAGAQVPLGQVGIQGSACATDTFAVTFSKKVDGSSKLSDALVAAFQGFVLPLHAETYQSLQVGDYLSHQFNATLKVGFGVTYGVDKVYFAGQYTADLPKGPAGLSVTASVQAEVQAGASMSATFKYTGSFEALLWKTDDNTGKLHLYKSKVTDANFNVGGTVAVIADPAVTVNPVNLKALATQVFPGGTGAVVEQLVDGPGQKAVNGWGADVQGKLTSWLAPFQQGKTQLQLAIDDTAAKYVLMDVTFDLTAAAFATAWGKAMGGDFCGALAVANGGASLDVGSGLENFHMQKTSLSFNLFGLFTSEWDATKVDNYSMLYAGNNTFHLLENLGRAQMTTVNTASHELDFYFAAEATSSGGGGPVAGEADLHVVLTSTGDKGFGGEIAGLLSSVTTGQTSSALSKQMQAVVQGNGTAKLEFLFKPAAYGRLAFSTVNGGNAMKDDSADRLNFQNFAQACGLLQGSAPANFKTTPPMGYDTWAVWNIAANDEYPPPEGSGPNRRQTGAVAAGEAYLTEHFGAAVPAQLTGYALQAASDYLNLCEDLKKLATLEDGGASWAALIADLQAVIKNDLAVDFIPSTAMALTESLGQAGVLPLVTGPAANAAGEPSICVTVVYP